MILDEINLNSTQTTYRFHLNMPRPGRVSTGPMVITGRVREKGTDFVRVRQPGAYREARDAIIPLHAIPYIEEIRRNQTYGE